MRVKESFGFRPIHSKPAPVAASGVRRVYSIQASAFAEWARRKPMSSAYATKRRAMEKEASEVGDVRRTRLSRDRPVIRHCPCVNTRSSHPDNSVSECWESGERTYNQKLNVTG